MAQIIRKNARTYRHQRIRSKIKGTTERPRLSVFRSNQHIWAQIIDDFAKKTIVAASDMETESREKGVKKGAVLKKHKKSVGIAARAERVGVLIAKKAKEKKVVQITFDRGGYTYHGAIKALADGARKEGLQF